MISADCFHVYSMVSRSGPVSGMTQARVLTAVVQEIDQGYSDVINRRPAGGQGSYHYNSAVKAGKKGALENFTGYSL